MARHRWASLSARPSGAHGHLDADDAVPQRTALSHAFGALAAALVRHGPLPSKAAERSDRFTMAILAIEVCWVRSRSPAVSSPSAKLQELLPEFDQSRLPYQNQLGDQRRAVVPSASCCALEWLDARPDILVLSSCRWCSACLPGDAHRRRRHADGDFAASIPTPACRPASMGSCSTTTC